ncbi:astacin-like isoform X3 [Scylla paramamosain]|uniref:astacin-like isoform X3 n=1 Tax=Scylla paramamosain TaxID=85552 RepID=UPI003083C447
MRKQRWVTALEVVAVVVTAMAVQEAASLRVPLLPAAAFQEDRRINVTDDNHTTNEATEGFGELQETLNSDWGLRLRRDPLELSGMDEGDIVPPPSRGIVKKNGLENKIAVRDSIKLWDGAVVPYEFSMEYTLLPIEQLNIRRVMRDIAKHSCIRFVKRTDEQDYLKIIVDRDRCYSYVGRVGGEQQLSLGLLCATWLDLGPIYHELFHALGFYHEHNRPDRDQYIEVNWDNIAEGSEKNFVKREMNTVELIDLPYDIDSVMHYSPFTFSKWSILTPTIKSKKKGYNFWRKAEPSKTDYRKLNRLYGCKRGRRARWLGRVGLPTAGNPYGGKSFTRRQPRLWRHRFQS